MAEELNDSGLSEGERHRLLAAETRRVVLDVLSDRPTAVGLEELAVAVAAESDDGVSVDRMKAVLHHTHLPKMADLGVVEYDPETSPVHSARTAL